MTDLDPNFLLPLWHEVIQFFSRHPPLVHGHGLEPQPVPGAVTSLDIPVESLAAVRRARYRPLIQAEHRLSVPSHREVRS